MNKAGELVYLIESDPNVRDEILQILVSSEFETKCFECAADYIANTNTDACACLIIEMEMKDINGLDLQRQLDPQKIPPNNLHQRMRKRSVKRCCDEGWSS